jgi:cytochrome c peroxidase
VIDASAEEEMRTVALFGFLLFAGVAASGLLPAPSARAAPIDERRLTPEQVLGARLFFDTSLSHPAGQSCGSCHSPSAAFSDPDKGSPTSKGVDPTLFGNRNAPTAAYAAFSPKFFFDENEGLWVGGQFLDGRAATLEDQARMPFLNPIEMANPDRASVIEKLRKGDHAQLFEQVYGPGSLADADRAFNLMAHAIAAFERSEVLRTSTARSP